jgi:UDP-N-acetylmuramoyl-L-alanyl-D-glutamate--2,6-diaminopimelate ligase
MNIKIDSRKVEKGDIFVALRGVNNDGHKYIDDAIKRGASKVVVEEGLYEVETEIVLDTHDYLIKYLKDNYYQQINNIKLIGVTGTNGKTTTCFLIQKALNKLGIKTGYIGTIGFYIDEEIRVLNNTTPDIYGIYEILLECAFLGCKYVAMEVSSHALDQKRVAGLIFDYAIFTNLTQDHLDYHHDFDDYALAKQKLFKMIKSNGTAIINADDEYKDYFMVHSKNITYGYNEAEYKIIDSSITSDGSNFILKGSKEEKYESKLLGKHNIYNLTGMIIILKLIGVDYDNIKSIVLESSAPTGRMDTIFSGTNRIIVDYAHTPDAISNVVSAVKNFAKAGVIVLIGCGGDRDPFKRPKMAKIATDLADYAIFTSDNPRTEDPNKIIDDMVNGLTNINYEIIVNREEAIKKGIQILKENDILLLLGKGHETYQIIGREKIHFDDKEIVLKNI